MVKKLRFVMLTALMAVSTCMFAQFADGNYYLKNVESGKFLAGSNSWGTQASLIEHAEYVTLDSLADGQYTIESRVSNGGTAYYFNGSYMDNSNPVHLTFAKSGDYYVITSDTVPTDSSLYFGYDGTSTVLASNLTDASAPAAQWQIISQAEMMATLATATADAPVDATFLIKDHNFGRNNRDKATWVTTGNVNKGGGDNANFCAESYHSNFTLTQVLADVPNGVYALTAQGFYRQDAANDTLPVFFANEVTTPFPLKTGAENSMNDASASFSKGNYTIAPILVEVKDDTLRIGAKLENNANMWCIWDHFALAYYGANVNMDSLKLASYVEAYNAAMAKLWEIDTYNCNDSVRAQWSAFVNATVEETVEGYTAATEAINAFIPVATNCATQKIAIDGMFDLLNSTNVYENEPYETFATLAADYLVQWEADTLKVTVPNPNAITGWHATTAYDFLLSSWTIGGTQAKEWDTALYINTWSTEGENDGSNFKVPFYEYWTGDANSLGATTISATVDGLVADKEYVATAWVRVRQKNAATDAPTGIKFSAATDSVDACAGAQVGTSQFYLAEISATGKADAEGKLVISFTVAADNNISWLSFKNVVVAKAADVTADPENGSTVTAPVMSIKMTFNGEAMAIVDAENSDRVQVINEETGVSAIFPMARLTAEGNVVTLENVNMMGKAPLFDKAGKYSIVIPSGKILVGADSASVAACADVKLTYTIEEAPVPEINFTTNPAAGSVVKNELPSIEFTFPDFVVVDQNNDGMMRRAIITKEGMDQPYAMLTNAAIEWGTELNQIKLNTNITEPGVYTIAIMPGMFCVGMSDQDPANILVDSLIELTYTIKSQAAIEADMTIEVNRVVNLGYTADNVAVDMAKICEKLGIESIDAATVWGVNGFDGAFIENAMATFDGWRNVDGDFATWGNNTSVCYKYAADGNFVLCTFPGNEPALGDTYNAYWAFTTATDTVILKTAITMIEAPAISFDVVKTITVNTIEKEKTSYSGNTLAFRRTEICEALGVADLSEVETYIVNVTTGEFVNNTTDGWRDANGDAANWGSGEGMVCVKLNDPTSGTFDYIGAIDETIVAGTTYTAKWAIVADGKAVVLEVVIKFVTADEYATGINGIAAEDIVKTEYIGLNGAVLAAPAKGINIVKYTLVDGTVVTAKVYVK